jgi:hypothetical protein
MSAFHSVSLDDSIPLLHYPRHPRFGEFWLSSSRLVDFASFFSPQIPVRPMLAALALTLAHWLVLASIDPSFWMSTPYVAAPVVAGILAAVGIVSSSRRHRQRPNELAGVKDVRRVRCIAGIERRAAMEMPHRPR